MKVKIAILVVLVYCGSLLVNLPAAAVVGWMPASTVKIDNVSGSLWNGQAKQVIINPKVTLHNVKWDIQLKALLNLAIGADVSFYNGPSKMSGKGFVQYGLTGVSASNVMVDLTSAELLALIPTKLPVKIEGEFSAVIQQIKQGDPYCEQLQGTVVWHNAFVYSQMGNVNLASPSVDLGCADGNITAFVTQDSEQLNTNLDINLGEGGIYQLNGEIQGKDELPPSIAQSLTWIGPKNDSGATTVSFNGVL